MEKRNPYLPPKLSPSEHFQLRWRPRDVILFAVLLTLGGPFVSLGVLTLAIGIPQYLTVQGYSVLPYIGLLLMIAAATAIYQRVHPKSAPGEGEASIPAPSPEESEMKEQRFPPGWNEACVREVIAHYESQSEDEQFAEIEAAREGEEGTTIAVPIELADEVRALIARKQSA